MLDKTKYIGVWGYGVTGKSVIDFLVARAIPCALLERKKLSNTEMARLEKHNVQVYQETNFTDVEMFFERCDKVIPSPGIDLRAYPQYNHTFLAELDFFAQFFTKPVIAITGTLGKTTVTTLCEELLRCAGLRVAVGGNIGTGLCDLIEQQEQLDYAVLEVSSFQLECTKVFAPNLALWTNFYANHVDRHGSIDAYRNAKLAIVRTLSNSGFAAIIPLDLKEYVYAYAPERTYYFTHTGPSDQEELKKIRANDFIIAIDNGYIVRISQQGQCVERLIHCAQLPSNTFMHNWVTLVAMLHILTYKVQDIVVSFVSSNKCVMPPYRLTYIGTTNGAPVYNDSKSTVPEATLAAIEELQHRSLRPIVLMIGGVSKGVDRTHFVEKIAAYIQVGVISSVVFFGAEACELSACAQRFLVPTQQQDCVYMRASLSDALTQALAILTHDMQFLFSPAGASFDLFSNYLERGGCFDTLVSAYLDKGSHVSSTTVSTTTSGAKSSCSL